MTSALRRKRQITVRSTPLATGLDTSGLDTSGLDTSGLDTSAIGLDVKHLGRQRSNNSRKWAAILPMAALACGTMISAWAQQAAAEQQSSQQSAVAKVSYSTGQSGGKLRWLPYRPGKNYSGRTVTRTATSESAGPKSQVVQDDPFAHRGGKIGSVSQLQNTAKLRDVAQLQNPKRGLPREPVAEPPVSSPPMQPGTQPPLGTLPSLGTLPPLGTLQTQPVQEPAVEDSFPRPVDEPSIEGTPVVEPPLSEQPVIEDSLDRDPITDPSQDTGTDDPLDAGRQSDEKREIVDIDCPSPDDLDPIDKITTDISIEPGPEPKECTLGDRIFEQRNWAPSTFMWKASGLCHKPLYFEDVQLERYGHSHGPLLQPIISGGRFFLTIPALPYLMGVEPPAECLYTLGYYRPGDCAPYMLDPIPLSVRGALFEAAAVTGMVYIIP